MHKLYTFLWLLIFIISCQRGYKKTDTGLRFKFHIQNQGVKKPSIGEVLYIHYTARSSSGELLFSSYEQNITSQMVLKKSVYPGDYLEALSMMSLGDSATFLLRADSFYKNVYNAEVPNNIEAESFLIITIRLLDIKSQEQAEELINKEKYDRFLAEYYVIESFIKKDGRNFKTTNDGIKYYIEQSTDVAIKDGDLVTYHIKMSQLDSAEFFNTYNTNQPDQFLVGQQFPIPFYNTIMPLMSQGSKGVFVIPFASAYNDKGIAQKIPPYTTIFAEIEILKVQKK